MSDSPHDIHRIRAYLGSMTIFGLGLATAGLVSRAAGRGLPARYEPQDLLLGALATHKFTRLVSKDGITTPLRAPFTEFVGEIGSAEVAEQPKKDSGVTHVLGELLTCPFCLAPWTAATYVTGLALAPRTARAWAAMFALVGASDFLQHAYGHVRTD